ILLCFCNVCNFSANLPSSLCLSRCKELKYAKDLPQISIIFIFVNEALSVILRSVHSAVNHTPAHLLKEIILVDDNSDEEELKAPLEEYVNKRYPGLVKVVRNQKREGLIRARIEGWKVASGHITGFFDAHVEFTSGWAEPVLSRIQENRKRVILPSIDNIKQDTFEVQRYENSAHGYSWELWCMYISPPKDWWDAGDPSLPIRLVLKCKLLGIHHVLFSFFKGDFSEWNIMSH
uniref:Polypeptide N-acetylgalactosaminyltransferase 17 n=1 Tax=Laticauda laticaudata TaxID=8630 RepID=A0A8C5SL92_LATLA